MRTDLYTKTMLTLVALFLGIIAARPLFSQQPVYAQAENRYRLYFEPGTHTLRAPGTVRQVLGKVAIDLRTGNVWGFPTLVPEPYPIDATIEKPPTSRPFLLGRFAVEDIDK